MDQKRNIYFCILIAFVIACISFFDFPSSIRSATTGSISATVAVGVCGNNLVEYGEDCDGSALDGQTCQSLGFDIGTLSCNIGCDFNVSECANLGPDEGSAVFSGRAYPSSVIKILKDGQIAATTAGDPNGNFETTLANLIVGTYSFAVYAYDNNGNRSKTITYSREITKDENEAISDIIVPPTLSADDDEVEVGEDITFFGQSAPGATVTINLANEDESWQLTATARSNGYYSYELDTEDYDEGDYTLSAKTTIGVTVSEYSEEASFEIVEVETESESAVVKSYKKVDFNDDTRVNLIDFSILIHWFESSGFPAKVDVNTDEKVNLSDFSIMMYHWTG